mmetsp:Transcript_10257/g.16793  ORF Transcript_10257/g.16793 Transcript_10257/m.16793 type:complete len:275 (+) Transcript_10257:229-1053(+)
MGTFWWRTVAAVLFAPTFVWSCEFQDVFVADGLVTTLQSSNSLMICITSQSAVNFTFRELDRCFVKGPLVITLIASCILLLVFLPLALILRSRTKSSAKKPVATPSERPALVRTFSMSSTQSDQSSSSPSPGTPQSVVIPGDRIRASLIGIAFDPSVLLHPCRSMCFTPSRTPCECAVLPCACESRRTWLNTLEQDAVRSSTEPVSSSSRPVTVVGASSSPPTTLQRPRVFRPEPSQPPTSPSRPTPSHTFFHSLVDATAWRVSEGDRVVRLEA